MADIFEQVKKLEEQRRKSEIEQSLLLQKALSSNDVDQIFKAQAYLQNIGLGGGKKQSEKSGTKSILIDPMSPATGMGYYDRGRNLSFDILRNMSRVWVIKAIIGTRIEQVCDFSSPQKDKYSTGFVIRPKKKNYFSDKEEKITKQQEREIERITEWVLNCGEQESEWHGDSFESFLRKWIQDSLSLDQGTFEVVQSLKGKPKEWFATDGATYRIADKWDEKYEDGEDVEEIARYVQVYQSRIISEFAANELCFGVRNPQTALNSYGYGRSELEDMVMSITSILNTDSYNANYFKIGSNPKGIIKVSGNFNPSRLEEFRQSWQASVSGVSNAHRTPVIEADKMDWVSTQASNKDMEYSKYYEFLIKICCAMYKIDPSEIGFPMQGSVDGGQSLFEGSNEARLKHSKDKGLKPLLKFVEHKINKYAISPYTDDKYELVFEGLDAETQEQEVEGDVKKVANFETINEIRRRRGLDDLPDGKGDVILNPVYMQAQQMAMMGDEESNQYIDEAEVEEETNPFIDSLNLDETFE